MSKQRVIEIACAVVVLGVIAGCAVAQGLEVKKPVAQPELHVAKPVAQPTLTVVTEPTTGYENYNPQFTDDASNLQYTVSAQK